MSFRPHFLFALSGFFFGGLAFTSLTERAHAYEGPRVSAGALPNAHIYVQCSNTSPTVFWTNTQSDAFVITDLWMTSSASNSAHGRLYVDGSQLVRMAAPANDVSLFQTDTGLLIESGQSLSCDRLSSYTIELTIIGYYAHTP